MLIAAENASQLAEIVRIFLIFIPATLIILYALIVIVSYFQAYRVDRYKKARTGLLPTHVWLIGSSYILLLIYAMLTMHERSNDHLTYHVFLLVPAFIAGIGAMTAILKYEQLRYRATLDLNIDIDTAGTSSDSTS